jgi:hypothetical protein
MTQQIDLNRTYHFAPAVGAWRVELVRLARSLESLNGNVLEEIEQESESVLETVQYGQSCASYERLRFAFALSLLHDILNAGGEAQVRDSEPLNKESRCCHRGLIRSALGTPYQHTARRVRGHGCVLGRLTRLDGELARF